MLKDTTYIRAWQSPLGKRDRRPPTGDAAFSAQDFLMTVAEGKMPAVIPTQPSRKGKARVMVEKER
jgi:hypothetical protein